jgi:nickel-dependent lactate racemase
MKIALKFGHSQREIVIPNEFSCDVLDGVPSKPLPSPEEAVRDALAYPIEAKPLRNLVKAQDRVVIVVNDITRLVHTDVFLPVVVQELNRAGIPDRQISVVFALGLHRGQTAEERRAIIGDAMAARLRVYDHDAFDGANLVSVGQTSRGNEVWINRRVHEADFVILTGEIIYHLLAGYSGGRKGLVPGVAGAQTITFNHGMFMDRNARCGVLEGNPIHEDLLEAARLYKPGFILNVVLHPQGGFSRVVAGDMEHAHRAGCRAVDALYKVEVPEPYDLVIASAGGFPFDIDLRQAHKGLENATRVLRPGGTLLFLAECPDGAGARALEEWLEKYSSSAEMEAELQHNFKVGNHKAYWIARLGERYKILCYSKLADRLVRQTHMVPVIDPQQALDETLAALRPGARIVCIPHSGLTLPHVAGGGDQGEQELNHARNYA